MPQNPNHRDQNDQDEASASAAPTDAQDQAAPEPRDKAESDGRPDWSRRAVTFGLAATTLGGLTGATQPGAPAAGAAAAPDAPVAAAPTAASNEFSIPTTWDIETTKNEQVDFFIEFLMFKNRDKTKLWLERLGYYGPMIQQKLAEHGMPQDMIWLAMIESGLDPNAYSSAHAAGLWQFIEETGERYGLEVSEYVDERRDPVASTDAALTYLKEMNDKFGSWYLAAAGYNSGENRVERIVNEKAGGKFGDESVFW
ncbi:MAG: lytic transglycosylase domain-containing protein, partial [Longimicrobiales bacterium]